MKVVSKDINTNDYKKYMDLYLKHKNIDEDIKYVFVFDKDNKKVIYALINENDLYKVYKTNYDVKKGQ